MTGVAEREQVDYRPASEILVGVRENQMIINGVVYCNFCWIVRPDDLSLCPCIATPIQTCEDCANTKDPCLFCSPVHHANHKIAMGEMEKIVAYMERQSLSGCPTCKDKGGWPCETCGYYPEEYTSEDPDQAYQDGYHDDPDY